MLLELGGIFLLVGVIFRIFPPKKVNSIYGHRTGFSMKNQDTWKEAQRFSANSFIVFGIILAIMGLLFNSFFGNVYMSFQSIVFFIGIILMIIIDEWHLRRVFNSDGTRKRKS